MANALRNIGKGLARGITADVLGMPVDTLNMLREGLLSPAAGGNPAARVLGGLLGPVQQTGSGDWFAQQIGLPQGEGLAYEAARMVSPSPSDVMGLLRRAPIQEIMTYHGTPHRFEPTPENPLGEFRASQIGTGEGAQAYGHGIYLAESPETAEVYKRALTDDVISVENKKLAAKRTPDARNDPESIAINEILAAHGGQYEDPFYTAIQRMKGEYGPRNENYKKAIELAREWRQKGATVEPGGNLYTADLPDEMVDRMLDWDKPLSEQPDNVKKALEPLVREALKKQGTPEGYLDYHTQRKKGGDIRELLRSNIGDRAFSEKMKELGIPGIKYFDASSRDVKEGTRNFVVFPGEEKKVKILKRE